MCAEFGESLFMCYVTGALGEVLGINLTLEEIMGMKSMAVYMY